jgi:flagellar hook-associated protein 1 FlgK
MSLLASLLTSSSTLSVFDRSVEVTQNNVTNATTPGYVTQRLTLDALPFDPGLFLPGGLRAGDVQSARNEFAEAAVRQRQESLGTFSQKSASLQAVEGSLDLSASSGIPGALADLFQRFSAWGLTPSSSTARQAVLDQAENVAASFRSTTARLAQASNDADRQITQTVDQINGLGAKLQAYNTDRQRGNRNDAALDAKIHNTLEELAQVVNYTALFQHDGSVTVMVGGQTPLVIGSHAYQISAALGVPGGLPPGNPGVPPSAIIVDAAGSNVTGQFTGGTLGALLNVRNHVIASFLGDVNQPGELNLLEQTFADRVNQLLTAGNISDGPPPQPGAPLFTYDTTNATRVAATLAVDSAVTPDQLAAIDPGPPYVSNGTALTLAGLGNSQNAADKIDNVSYTEFYGNLAAGVGRQLSDAVDQKDIQKQLLTQAQSLREQVSGVSLDEQAVLLVQFQRAYQANAKLITVLSELTQVAVNLLP